MGLTITFQVQKIFGERTTKRVTTNPERKPPKPTMILPTRKILMVTTTLLLVIPIAKMRSFPPRRNVEPLLLEKEQLPRPKRLQQRPNQQPRKASQQLKSPRQPLRRRVRARRNKRAMKIEE